MTLGELGLWMESAIELLLSGNFKQLTIGQTIYLIFGFLGIVSFIIWFFEIIHEYWLESIFIAIVIIITLFFIFKSCSSSKNCERCKGDGYVDQNDINDLGKPTFEKNGKTYHFEPGTCTLCNKVTP